MKFNLSVLLSALVLLIAISQMTAAVNYCQMATCSGKHIDCNNNNQLAASCTSTAKIIRMTKAVRSALLKRHNTLRNTIAKGAVTKYKPATRMATMVWDEELARLARLNVKQCKMMHDDCRATAKFPFAGQNLAYTRWSTKSRTVKDIAIKQVNLWYNEKANANMTYILKYKKGTNGKKFGHFTQMMQERATHIGCGILRETRNGNKYQFMACNYAFANVFTRPVYTNGTAASGCTTGTNPNYPYLCSIKEKYNVTDL